MRNLKLEALAAKVLRVNSISQGWASILPAATGQQASGWTFQTSARAIQPPGEISAPLLPPLGALKASTDSTKAKT